VYAKKVQGESGDIALFILKLGTTQKSTLSFMPRIFCYWEKRPTVPTERETG